MFCVFILVVCRMMLTQRLYCIQFHFSSYSQHMQLSRLYFLLYCYFLLPPFPSSLSLSPLSLSLSLSLQRLAVVLLVIHYTVEFVFNASCLLHYHGKDEVAQLRSANCVCVYIYIIVFIIHFSFKLWWFLFLLARVASVVLSIVTLW